MGTEVVILACAPPTLTHGPRVPPPMDRLRAALTGRRVGPPPARRRAATHPGTRASRPPGTRASRPQPYFWLEVVERRRNVAGRQPPCRRERHWPVRMKGKAPLPVDPSGGVGRHCAGQMCGRDARVPGWAIPFGRRVGPPPARRRASPSRRLPLKGGVILEPRIRRNHSPLEGESQKPSRMAKADAVGGKLGVPRVTNKVVAQVSRREMRVCVDSGQQILDDGACSR